MTNASKLNDAQTGEMNITLADAPETKATDGSNLPGLAKVLKHADAATLAATLARIVDIYPHAYTLALSGAQCNETCRQEKLDELENIVGGDNLGEAFDDRQYDWNLFNKQLTEFFENLDCDAAILRPVVEYALGRVLLFRSLCDEIHYAELDKILKQLKEIHINCLQEYKCDGTVLLELLTQWQIDLKSEFISASLQDYSSFLDKEALLNSRVMVESDWLKHFKNESWCDHSEDVCRRYRGIANLIKGSGMSERLQSWLNEDLAAYGDYYEALQLLRECGLHVQAEQILKQAVKHLPKDDASWLLYQISGQMEQENNFSGAAETMFLAYVTFPSLAFLEELNDFIDKHLANEWPSWAARLFEFLHTQLDKSEAESALPSESVVLNSALITLLVRDQQIEEAWQRAKLGCHSTTMQTLMQASGNLPYTRIQGIISPCIEVELAARSNCSLIQAEKLLLVLYRAVSGNQDKQDFQQYLKALKNKFNLKGKSASLLRRVGFN